MSVQGGMGGTGGDARDRLVEFKLTVEPGGAGAAGGGGPDPERVDDLSRRLARELREVDGVAVRPASGGPLPAGAKAGMAAEFGSAIVSLAPAVVSDVVRLIQSWLTRPGNAGIKVSVRTRRGSVVIEGGKASAAEVVELLRAASTD
jgi:hypothetical protein